MITLPLGLNRLEWAERNEIVRVMREAKGNKSLAAQLIPMARESLYFRIKKYKITNEDLGF